MHTTDTPGDPIETFTDAAEKRIPIPAHLRDEILAEAGRLNEWLTEKPAMLRTTPLGEPRTRAGRRVNARATAKAIVKARRKARQHEARAQIAALPAALREREYARDDLAAAAAALPDDALLADVLAEAARIADERATVVTSTHDYETGKAPQ